MEVTPLATRQAAKGILYTNDERIVVVAGKRGMWNLPGGGLKPDETPESALNREISEELGVNANDLTGLDYIGGTWGVVTPEFGEAKRALWHLFTGELRRDSTNIRYDNEITGVDLLSRTEILKHNNMSELVKYAILHTMALSKGNNRP